MHSAIEAILQMSECDLQHAIAAVMVRFSQIHAHHELVWMALRKDPALHQQDLERITGSIRSLSAKDPDRSR